MVDRGRTSIRRGWDGWSLARAVAVLAAVGGAYASLSELAYRWFDADGTSASFFPAAGVTLAALVTLRRRWWPSVLLGAGLAEVLLDVAHDIPWNASIKYAGANLAQPLIGALLLTRWHRRLDLARLGHLTAFLLGAVAAAPMAGAALGASVAHDLNDRTWWRFAGEWWVGDGLGVLVVGGTLLGLRASTPHDSMRAGRAERVLLGLSACIAASTAFRLDWFPLVYLPAMLIFVVAVRGGTRDTALVGALVALISAEATASGHRFWDDLETSDSTGLLYLQLALAMFISGGLVMAAAVSEREVSAAARSRAEAERREAVAGRGRAELLGRLAESLGRATTPQQVFAALHEVRIDDVVALDTRAADDGDTAPPASPASHRAPVDDRFVVESARRMANDALARVQLIEHERSSRERAEMLEHHAARLAAAASIEEIAHATVDALFGLRPRWAAVWQLVDDSSSMLAERGRPGFDTAPARWSRLGDEHPLGDAVTRGRMVSIPTRSELFHRYPEVMLDGASATVQSVVVVPLHAQDLTVIGALAVVSDEAHWTTDDRRQVILSLADQCGLALDRAVLQRTAALAAADAALLARLSDALDRATTASERARQVIAELRSRGARAAAVEVVEDDGERVVLASSGEPAELCAPDVVLSLQARGRRIGRLQVTGLPTGIGGTRELLHAVASRAAIAIDNARLYERERDVSHRLQLGLLDVSFPQVEGIRIDGAYRPGTATLDIGGDWHDAFLLPSGMVALVVGDVVGHGVEAAIAMAQLRGAVRALAAVSSPSELLDRLDSFVDSLPDADMTTLVYVELDPTTGRMRYACAGHPPPMIVSAAGVSRMLWGARSTPLGRQFRSRRVESIDVLADVERLVLYTDGLVERRGERLDTGFERLLATSAHDVASADFVERLCDRMLDGVPQRDDVCLLTATRLDGRSYTRSIDATPSDLGSLRRELQGWIGGWIDVDEVRHDVLLAVSEAVSNAVEHGVAGDGQRPIVVVATMGDGQVRITVRDHGVWREPVPSTERGRGLGIMRALMDQVVVERHDDGTVVRLARSLPG